MAGKKRMKESGWWMAQKPAFLHPPSSIQYPDFEK
jgi:hypothetical protein